MLADEPIASLDPRNTRNRDGQPSAAQPAFRYHGRLQPARPRHREGLLRRRLVGMAQGRVVFDGAPDELTESAARELYGLEADEAMSVLPPAASLRARSCLSPPEPPNSAPHPIQRRNTMRMTRRLISHSRRHRLRRHRRLRAGLEVAVSRTRVRRRTGGECVRGYAALPVLYGVSCEGARGEGDQRIAADYAAVIEGQKAGNIHIAEYGPSSYVRAWTVTGGGVEPFVSPLDANGVTGYYSVAYARRPRPERSWRISAARTSASSIRTRPREITCRSSRWPR